jgi:predicted CopG family antitoxin
MATKTISIDLEAYDRLRKVRKGRESFSETIKRVVKPPLDFQAFCRKVEDFSLDDKVIEALERQIEERHKPSNRGS